MYPLRTPLTKTVPLEKRLRVLDGDIQSNISGASKLRDQVKFALDGSSSVAIRDAIESYLPTLMTMNFQISKSEVMLTGSLDFCWNSIMVRPSQNVTTSMATTTTTGGTSGRNSVTRLMEEKFFVSHLLSDDINHMLLTLALIYYQLAQVEHKKESEIQQNHENTDSDKEFSEKKKCEKKAIETRLLARRETIRLLRTGAGIITYLLYHQATVSSASEQSTSPRNLSRKGLMLDLRPPVLSALHDLFLANVQEIMVEGGLENQTSPALLSQLCTGIYQQYDAIAKQLEQDLGLLVNVLDPNFLPYLKLKSQHYEGLSLYYSGLQYEGTGEHGQCIAFLKLACNHWNKITLDLYTTELSFVRNQIRTFQEDGYTRYNRAAKDNENVYYRRLVSETELTLPKPLFAAKDILYTPPNMLSTPFFSSNKKFPMTSSSSSSTPSNEHKSLT